MAAIGDSYRAPTPPSTTTVNTPSPVFSADPVRPQDLARQGSLSASAAAGEASFASPNQDGIDYSVLALDMAQAANLSVDINAVMTLLIEVMAEMRKVAKKEWLEGAQAALQTGLDAAQKMIDAADKTLNSAVISASISIAASAIQMGSGMAGNSASDSAGIATKGLSDLASAAGKLGTAFIDHDAAVLQAEAQADRSTGEYQQAIAQADQDFANQIRDVIAKLLETMKSVSEAQHQATGAIYGV
jgi:hypothetical protein